MALCSCKSRTVVQPNTPVEKPIVNSNKAFFDKISQKDDYYLNLLIKKYQKKNKYNLFFSSEKK